MKLVVAAWFVVMAVAALVLPAFRGEIDASARVLVIAALAGVAAGALAVARRRVRTRREALVSSLPALGLLAAAAVVGFVLYRPAEDFRGAPIFLFFGIALLASWGGPRPRDRAHVGREVEPRQHARRHAPRLAPRPLPGHGADRLRTRGRPAAVEQTWMLAPGGSSCSP